VFRRAKNTVSGLIVFGLLLVSVLSCDPVERHQVLTFFFDGVPPLDGDTAVTEDSRTESGFRSLRRRDVGERQGTIWFVHEPWKNRKCNLCHRRLEQAQWALPELTAPVPELCYDCHTDHTVSAAFIFVHGPVAVGECLLCHNAHKSKIAGLLKKKEPELCYQCHETIKGVQIAGHPDEPIQQCTNCHDPHAGLTRMFLKSSGKYKQLWE